MTTPETRTLEVPVFRSPDGRPTCSVLTVQDKTCRFLRFHKLGTVAICGLALDHVHRDGDGLGYLRPCEGCPLWG